MIIIFKFHYTSNVLCYVFLTANMSQLQLESWTLVMSILYNASANLHHASFNEYWEQNYYIYSLLFRKKMELRVLQYFVISIT